MTSNRKKYKKLCIDIITYRTEINDTSDSNYNQSIHAMNTAKDKLSKSQNKFICSICLNQKNIDTNESELTERISKSCPICQHSYTSSVDGDSSDTKDTRQSNKSVNNDRTETKNVQTIQADVSQGLTLLHEVLSAFQCKKQIGNRKDSPKTLILKDVGVSTDDITNLRTKPKLTMSKVFKCSIDDKCGNDNKFTIVNSSQPEKTHEGCKSLNLINRKSSSIPQMKLEELKNSLKEKTKSKDAMEEANRIFANVKKLDNNNTDNRPMIRNGPRVLPVVKTANFEENTTDKTTFTRTDQTFNCCQHNFNLSSGDSDKKCLRSCKKCLEKCDNCMHICCHCKQNRQQAKEICKRCRTVKHELEHNR